MSDFLSSGMDRNIPQSKTEKLKYIPYIITHCEVALPVTVQYLNILDQPISTVKIRSSTTMSTTLNHTLSKCIYSKLTSLGVNFNAVLMNNFVFDIVVINGSIGKLVHVVYQSSTGPS